MVALGYFGFILALAKHSVAEVPHIADLEVKHAGDPESVTKDTPQPGESHEGSVSGNIADDVALKKELSDAASKLSQTAEVNEDSRRTLDSINKEQGRIEKELDQAKVDNINELQERKRAILKRIASLGKTLRVEHDARFPHLIGQPIIIVAKDDDDTKRTANTLAHIEGIKDTLNRIRSPCSSLVQIRSDTLDNVKSNNHNRFAVVQRTLDSMSIEERLNYDRKMIAHYEGIIRELEDGIAEADAEINASWQSYKS
ncbi:hypothetical protein BBOV_II007300 [Babesia bovis T2Bo]|uniref:Membrane protein, putative n=1 Tax=Babesia bovis TaxID=5865 RepID=A7AUR9_BABBO|nr:hypothetical protein BBOV_II007300 [Babesia bovis T2Bo]EDO06680.1 hypothetical protein BBOV_II007300 [Babesia bovis T2Bo]|eukprot:XP_001610248.1 membrane protein [Babesia bovis T2Bo]